MTTANIKRQLIKLHKKVATEQPAWYGYGKPNTLENTTTDVLDCFNGSRYNCPETAVNVFLEKF